MASPIDYSIKDVEKVVKFDGKIKNVETSRLTAPGENYLSLVLRVDFEVEKNGHSKTVSSVAKCLPLSARNQKNEAFNMHGVTMKNEIRWYTEMVPLLKKFAKENDIEIDFFPEYYGSRYSLNPSSQEADCDSVLLLENLIPQGYKNDDRYIGCDYITSKAILKSLAIFHALPIALKVKKPETFQILKDFLESSRPKPPGEGGPDGEKKHFGPPPGAQKPEEMLLEELAKLQDFAPYISKIKPLLENQSMGPELFDLSTEEPWNTIVHGDFWVNNVMTNSTTKASDPLVKIVDFQMGTYGSFAKDLTFFLLSSLTNDVTRDSIDDLLKCYYEEFTTVLEKTNTNLKLTYEDFLEEVRSAAVESEVSHAINFSTIIFGEKGTGVDVAVVEFEPHIHLASIIKNMNADHKNKLVVIACEATKRNWIKTF